MKNKIHTVTMGKRDFNIMLIESFRYALNRTYTWASQDCAKRIIEYWDYIEPGFKTQIKRDVREAIVEDGKFGDKETKGLWKEVLKLDINKINGKNEKT